MISHCVCDARNVVLRLSYQNDRKYPGTNTRLASGHFSFSLHHSSILHCILRAAGTIHLDLHTLINMAFAAGKGQHQLTFPSYQSACASNNNSPWQQDFITHCDTCAGQRHEDLYRYKQSV